MIGTATQDLEDHLEEITMKLRALTPLDSRARSSSSKNLQWLGRERQSMEECLKICAQGLDQIDKLKRRPLQDGEPSQKEAETSGSAQHLTLAEIMTILALRKLSDDLAHPLRDKEEQVLQRSLASMAWATDQMTPTSQDELLRLAGESDSTNKPLAVLPPAAQQVLSSSIHVAEDVYIDIGGEQILITSHNQVFEVRRVRVGNGARQVVISSSETGLHEFLRSYRNE